MPRGRIACGRCQRGGKNHTIFLEPLPAARDLQPKFSELGLSKRQAEIALWVIRGLSNREIAERLFITEQTVKDHVQDVFQKARVHHRSALIATVLGLRPEKS